MAAPPDFTDLRLQKLQALAMRHEIRPDWVVKLRQLENFSIVMICDDSGSMNTVVRQPSVRTMNPYGRNPTRWDELMGTASLILDVASTLSNEGIDLYFLNRPPIFKCTGAEQIQSAFAYSPPSGYTPLVPSVQQVFQNKRDQILERKLLLIIATDGQPTDMQGNVQIANFIQTLKNKHKNVYVSILACTDDDASVAYLNDVDRDVPNVDVSDDYSSEKKEVLRAQGSNFHFTYGDYVVKALLGSVDPYFDQLDAQPGCCTIV